MNNIPTTIDEAKKLFETGHLTPSRLVEHYLQVINEKNPTLNAVLETYADATDFAKQSDVNYQNKQPRALEGIPFLVKDCILVGGHTASAGSQILKTYKSSYDATVIKIIKENGGIILGRTNMDEFALGGSGENSSYGKTLNPIDQSRVPGGSSSGSASALSAGMCLVALGSDTGGSVRQPASFCGLFGYKPTYGEFSRSGLIAAASSLDTIGVFANSPSDIQLVHDLLAKFDILDNTSIPTSLREINKKDNKQDIPAKVKIAFPKDYIESEGISSEVKENFYEQLENLKQKGVEVSEISFETLKYALSIYYIINTAEVSSNLSRMDGLRFGGGDVGEVRNYQELFAKNRGKFFGPEVKRRIMIGSYVLSHGYYDAFYGKALQIRAKIKEEFAKLFQDFDFIVMPTAPTTAFKSGEIKDPLTLYLEDIFTVPANLAGIPAISVPNKKDTNGLPHSIQILADYQADSKLLSFVQKFF